MEKHSRRPVPPRIDLDGPKSTRAKEFRDKMRKLEAKLRDDANDHSPNQAVLVLLTKYDQLVGLYLAKCAEVERLEGRYVELKNQKFGTWELCGMCPEKGREPAPAVAKTHCHKGLCDQCLRDSKVSLDGVQHVFEVSHEHCPLC